MSDEAFGILRRLDPCSLETQVALQCAPLLTGIKMSNLLNVSADRKEEVFRLFEKSPISCYLLYEAAGKGAIFLYRENRVKERLMQKEIWTLLTSFGYESMDMETILAQLARRYQAHMEGRRGFPHEIGLLLGYPPEDVTGFIEKDGKDFLYSGYWKVYGNVEESRKTFEGYDRAREAVIRMAGNGTGIRDIMAAYNRMRRRKLII